MRWVNLKKEPKHLLRYVALRNKYARLLLTGVVSVKDTRAWISRPDVEVFGLEDAGGLAGAVVLYLKKRGEVAFFADRPNKGIGTRLLCRLLKEAKKKRVKRLWAWVLEDNAVARHVFEKSGFLRLRRAQRVYRGVRKNGIIFKKCLTETKG